MLVTGVDVPTSIEIEEAPGRGCLVPLNLVCIYDVQPAADGGRMPVFAFERGPGRPRGGRT